ncbi:hypothetical protein C8A00DRAFT_38031 [Chaetomidium leptoderma]|uniref:Uncharacterized protein n=1 Tax=Chaetomidium leptoderma TaxID=669021 RepID=A0AAN6VF45_9PEZI|nr:hypothetical protein C8A00DRAFT_38031 [Chaetomidium leptoderma]
MSAPDRGRQPQGAGPAGVNAIPVAVPRLRSPRRGSLYQPPLYIEETHQGAANFVRDLPQDPSPIWYLTNECQRRHCNPEWDMRQDRAGKYICHVRIRGHFIRSDRMHDTPLESKSYIALKALEILRTWPTRMDSEEHARQRARDHSQQLDNRRHRRQLSVTPEEEDLAGVTPHRGTTADRARERAEFYEQVRRMMPGHTRATAESTQSFIEGLVAGARLADPAARDRSRSPHSPPAANYRERSPPRDRADPPPPYNPLPDHYRPNYNRRG